MRVTLASFVLVGAALAAPLAQTSNDKPDKKPAQKAPLKTLALSGCVVRTENTDQFTLDDLNEGKYRLTGVNGKDYLGQRVQIAGAVVETKRFTVKGGLLPNPNVAAQAGAIDPARAAVASAGGAAGPGTVDLPEFKVKSVRPADGECPH
ncbi:MAG: hypothetical protein JWL71_1640 [Acidobacteria bacterium]|nr:hypothetical protein [Acidobacteriota bacterium]